MNLNDIAKFHEESKKTQFECKFCLKTYVRKTTLKAHSRKSIPCKGEVSKKLTKSADNGSADNLSINLEAISCEICKEEFPNEFRYRLHLNNAPRCSNELAQENRSLSSDSEEETSKSQTNSEMEFENDSNASEITSKMAPKITPFQITLKRPRKNASKIVSKIASAPKIASKMVS